MQSNYLNVCNYWVSFFIQVLLDKTKTQIAQKETLHKVVSEIKSDACRDAKCWVISIGKDVVARDDQHDNIEYALPRWIFFDDKEVHHMNFFFFLSLLKIHVSFFINRFWSMHVIWSLFWFVFENIIYSF
jgi:hypothetical protein